MPRYKGTCGVTVTLAPRKRSRIVDSQALAARITRGKCDASKVETCAVCGIGDHRAALVARGYRFP